MERSLPELVRTNMDPFLFDSNTIQTLSTGNAAAVSSEANADACISRYKSWLKMQPFSEHTKRNYVSQVERFVNFVQQAIGKQEDFSSNPARLQKQVEDYITHLRNSASSKASSINTSLTAIASFQRFLGLGSILRKREKLLAKPPRILTREENARLLEVLEECASPKECAIVLLFLSTGIRLGECAALTVNDISLIGNSGTLAVYNEKTGDSRKLPLHEPTATACALWLEERHNWLRGVWEKALFINYRGKRISTQGLDLIVRKMGINARMILSAQVLRDTCLANLASESNDPFLVARTGGHTNLNSVRKYFELG
jgi:integrase/recombinase XerD